MPAKTFIRPSVSRRVSRTRRTSVVLSLSFGILMTSRFVPVFQFGLLSAVLMVTALFADLVLNPCLLIWLKPKVSKMV